MDIREILEHLDPESDDHWTVDGLPKVDVISEALGVQVTRAEITDAAPGFGRAVARDAREAASQPPPIEEPPPLLDPAFDVAAVVAADPAAIDIVDDVVGMDPNVVYADVTLVDRAITEFSRQHDELARRESLIGVKRRELSRRVALLERAKSRVKKPSEIGQQVRDYLARQREVRERRAEAARKFIEAGTSMTDVSASLSRSKMDEALSRRRRPVGSPADRPAYPRAIPNRPE